MHKIANVRDIGKVVFDKGHEKRQSQHDEEACEEDPGEIAISPGLEPVLLRPSLPIECLILFARKRGSLARSKRHFVHAKDGDE